jgi:phosphoglycerate dehydrogenase-like enzyme
LHVAIALDTATMRLVERRLQEAGFEVAFLRNDGELSEHLPGARFVLVEPPPRIDWSIGTALELVQSASSSIDKLFPAAGLAPHVHIANARGAHADAVRDHVFSLMLTFARDLSRALEQQQARTHATYPSVPLAGQALCLIGLGEVGRRVAATARSFGMRVHAVRADGAPDPVVDAVFAPNDLAHAVSEADYVVACAPLTTKTRGLVSREVIALLPFQSVFINVSRAALVDQDALETALRRGRLRGAGLDVFADEPLAANSTLWSCPRLLITPHLAGHTPNSLDAVLDSFVENVSLVREGHAPRTVVCREREY